MEKGEEGREREKVGEGKGEEVKGEKKMYGSRRCSVEC